MRTLSLCVMRLPRAVNSQLRHVPCCSCSNWNCAQFLQISSSVHGLNYKDDCSCNKDSTEVVIGPPSRKRSCPEPDDIMAFATESSDSSQLVPCVYGRPMHGCPKNGSLFTPIANDVVDA